MGLTKQFVTETLQGYRGTPGTPFEAARDLAWVAACDATASLKVREHSPDPERRRAVGQGLLGALRQAASAVGGNVDSLVVEFVDATGKVVHQERPTGVVQGTHVPLPSQPAPGTVPAAAPPNASGGHSPIPGLDQSATGLEGVSTVIAVGAGKGGVGKSTIALNLAVGLARNGHSVGILDGDIYGPSMPTMLGLDGLDPIVRQGVMEPFYVHGVKCITMGKLVQADKPLIWRGPMAHGAFRQLLQQTNWGPLDYLIIDLPPGTGDISLTMAQLLRLTGAVVVCTPQKVAQDDATRATRMFEQLGIDVLGVVENMSYFVGDDGKEYDLFGKGGAQAMARKLNVPFLGSIPITTSLRVHSDAGNPTANFTGKDRAGLELAERFKGMVKAVAEQAALARVKRLSPTLTIS